MWPIRLAPRCDSASDEAGDGDGDDTRSTAAARSSASRSAHLCSRTNSTEAFDSDERTRDAPFLQLELPASGLFAIDGAGDGDGDDDLSLEAWRAALDRARPTSVLALTPQKLSTLASVPVMYHLCKSVSSRAACPQADSWGTRLASAAHMSAQADRISQWTVKTCDATPLL